MNLKKIQNKNSNILGPVLAVQSLLQMNQKNLTNYREAFQMFKKVPNFEDIHKYKIKYMHK